MSQTGFSKACCSAARVQADYSEKGEFIEIGEMKTYKTGPTTATSAVMMIYDAFGFGPQIFQGADILADSYNLQVFVPDFFRGNPAAASWFPTDTEEKKQKLDAWVQGPALLPVAVAGAKKVVEAIKSSGSITKVAAVGYCWGAKISYLIAQEDTLLSATAGCHPSFVDVNDATKITIPICILNSKDEDKEIAKQFEANLTVDKHVETFHDQNHGWMAARADLQSEYGREQFARGYKTLGDFYSKYL